MSASINDGWTAHRSEHSPCKNGINGYPDNGGMDNSQQVPMGHLYVSG